MPKNNKALFDIGRLSPRRQKILTNFQQKIDKRGPEAVNIIPDDAGILQSNPAETKVNPIEAKGEYRVGPKFAGAPSIKFGHDRPSNLASGYGGPGSQRCRTIDIVAGPMAGAREGRGPAPDSWVDPNFGADAARIYISEKTDIDRHFGLAAGHIGMKTGVSAIGMKADAIRIIGRTGIKITTGRSFAFKGFGKDGELTSGGRRIQVAPPIELNAGNQSGEHKLGFLRKKLTKDQPVKMLQGVARGENTRDCIKELSDILGQFIGAIERMSYTQVALATATGITYLEPWRAGASTVTVQEYISSMQTSLRSLRINKSLWEVNYCTYMGSKYIASRNVFST